MKSKLFLSGAVTMLAVIMTAVTACIKEADDTLVLQKKVHVVDIDDPDEVQDNIGVEDGTLSKGNLPTPTPGNDDF